MGSVIFPSLRVKNKKSKYYVPTSLYNKTYYPPYLSGGGFLMSSLLAKKILLVMQTIQLIPIDDAFIGICLEILGIKPVNHRGFLSWGFSSALKAAIEKSRDLECVLRNIMTFHKVSDRDMFRYWKLVQVNHTRLGYFDHSVCSTQFHVDQAMPIQSNNLTLN